MRLTFYNTVHRLWWCVSIKKRTNSSILMSCAHRQTNLVKRHTIGYWQIHISKHIWHGANYMVVPIPSFHLPHSMLTYKEILQLIETKTFLMARNIWGSFACYVWCLYWYKHLKMKLPHRLHKKKTCTGCIYFYVAHHSVPYASVL